MNYPCKYNLYTQDYWKYLSYSQRRQQNNVVIINISSLPYEIHFKRKKVRMKSVLDDISKLFGIS